MLLPGDRVLFYSDGLIESHNQEREMLGSHRLRDLLTDQAPDAEHLTAYVVAELGRFTGEQLLPHQAVIDQLPEESEMREDLLEIRSAAKRGSGLTRQLLIFSRRDAIRAWFDERLRPDCDAVRS